VGVDGLTLMKIPDTVQAERPYPLGGLASGPNVIVEASVVLQHVSALARNDDRTVRKITIDIDTAAHVPLVERLSALRTARGHGR
jgi:hypothetical protein